MIRGQFVKTYDICAIKPYNYASNDSVWTRIIFSHLLRKYSKTWIVKTANWLIKPYPAVIKEHFIGLYSNVLLWLTIKTIKFVKISKDY